MNDSRAASAAASQSAAKLGERGAVRRVGNERRRDALGENDAIVRNGMSVHRLAGVRGECSAGTMLDTVTARRRRGLAGRIVAVVVRKGGRIMAEIAMHRDNLVRMPHGAESDRHRCHRPHGQQGDHQNQNQCFQETRHSAIMTSMLIPSSRPDLSRHPPAQVAKHLTRTVVPRSASHPSSRVRASAAEV